ncbi:hypothetical protein MJ389_09175 [Escherichia coli]|nr:hypothetical protein MJ389_09175 [Escherichia coli]
MAALLLPAKHCLPITKRQYPSDEARAAGWQIGDVQQIFNQLSAMTLPREWLKEIETLKAGGDAVWPAMLSYADIAEGTSHVTAEQREQPLNVAVVRSIKRPFPPRTSARRGIQSMLDYLDRNRFDREVYTQRP